MGAIDPVHRWPFSPEFVGLDVEQQVRTFHRLRMHNNIGFSGYSGWNHQSSLQL
jgi:hypothetical protein